MSHGELYSSLINQKLCVWSGDCHQFRHLRYNTIQYSVNTIHAKGGGSGGVVGLTTGVIVGEESISPLAVDVQDGAADLT